MKHRIAMGLVWTKLTVGIILLGAFVVVSAPIWVPLWLWDRLWEWANKESGVQL